MTNKKLFKTYGKNYQKFRRAWVNLYRHKKGGIDPMAYIMLALFLTTVLMKAYTPFLIGWIFVAISFIYWRIFPQSWAEMKDYEKVAYRDINQLPLDWEPTTDN